jgi:DNA-binding transcriptional ArsR family regulator
VAKINYAVLRAIGSDDRFDILAELGKGPKYPKELISVVSKPQSISHHLRVLREAGLVNVDESAEYTLNAQGVQAILEMIGGLL